MSANKTEQAREQILEKIRKALSADRLPIPFPEAENWDPKNAFERRDISMEELFAENFIGLGGKFIYCENQVELLEQVASLYDSRDWSKLFCSDEDLLKIFEQNKLDFVQPADNTDESADACITSCEALVARTGSFFISSRQHLGRVSPVFYPVHIVIAYQANIVYDIEDGMEKITQKYPGNFPSMISLQTGPSRTADIEKTLVTGVHGPKEVFCFYVNV